MTALESILKESLAGGATMPFSSFMAAALYHPRHGYYAAGAQRTGRRGDFYTSVSVGPVFARILAGEFCAAWERLGKPDDFCVIEAGANDGQFAHDVMTWARDRRPDFFACLTYQIDEPLPANVIKQRGKLAEFTGKITHDAVGPATAGCYFANELLDAVPCRRVCFTGGQWMEIHIGLDAEGTFVEILKEPEDGALVRRLAWLGMDFSEGYRTEMAPAVASQIRLAAQRLARGYLFFADYGYAARDDYAPHRTTGTLRCYRNHRAHEDPLVEVGETDITAHVDFSLAAQAAVGAGCGVLGFLDQSRFLTGASAGVLAEMEQGNGEAGGAWRRQFQTLTHPAHLGQKFHFLVLGKEVAGLGLPAGLTFARPSAVAELLDAKFGEEEDPGGDD
ncbi:MAG: hypothetical protein JWL81_406 [Verrucomicrobiales bacterium]|nr:hypothetical protein [Verrucomicrobiales bacterium]